MRQMKSLYSPISEGIEAERYKAVLVNRKTINSENPKHFWQV